MIVEPPCSNLPERQVRHRGAHHGVDVDAAVAPERRVLDGDHRVLEQLRDLAQRDELPILPPEGGHHAALLVVDDRPLRHRLQARHRVVAVLASAGDDERAGNHEHDGRRDADRRGEGEGDDLP